jgi:uncharacterized protein with PIN domain
MLGRLATYLRMCGYDTVYAPDAGLTDDDDIHALARADGRTLVNNPTLVARTSRVLALLRVGLVGEQASRRWPCFSGKVPV